MKNKILPSFNIKYIFFLSFIFLSFLELNGQNKITGTVHYQDGKIIDGALISVLETDSTTFIKYTSTDAQGKWAIDVPEQDSFILEFSMFGYGRKFLLITDPSQYIEPIEVYLKKTGFNLDAVTIKDNAIGVSREEDTLTFNLKYFTTGAERTLGDIISRLPGMEIREGAVYYGGEKITKLLVQGRDIITNQKLATEGIRADHIKTIKIIENYKGKAQQYQSSRSDDVAMDVRLKEDVLNQWSGEIEVLGGYPHSFKGNLNAFKVGGKVGVSTFIRANNVGEEVLGWDDIQGMLNTRWQGGMRFISTGSSFSALMPSALSISDRVQSNKDGIVNLNLDYQATEDINIKGFIIAAYAQRESEVFNKTVYLSEEITKIENSYSTSETPIASMVWKMDYQIDSLTFLRMSLPLSLNKSDIVLNNSGTYGSKLFNTVNTSDNLNYLILPNLIMRRKVGQDGQWRINLSYTNTRSSVANYFRDDLPFLGIPISEDSSFYSILQDKNLKQDNFNAYSSLKLVWGDWFVRTGLEYAYSHDREFFDADKQGVVDFDKDAELKQHAGSLSITGGYETSDWEIAPSITLNVLDQTFVKAGKNQEFFPGYSFLIRRKFSRAHSLTLRGSYGLNYPDFNDVKGTYEINSSTGLSTGSYPIDIAQTGYNASLHYRIYSIKNELYMYSRVSYSYSDNVVSGLRKNFSSYILMGRTMIPYTQNFFARLYMGKELNFIPFRIGPRFRYSWSEGFATSGGENLRVLNDSYSAGIRVDSRWEFPLNVELDFDFNYNTSEQENGRTSDFIVYNPGIELEYKIGAYRVETDFEYNLSKGGNESSEIYTWDIETSYEFKNVPLTISIIADNILNLQPKERLVNSFGLNVNSFTRYQVFPGYIIGGVSWNF